MFNNLLESNARHKGMRGTKRRVLSLLGVSVVYVLIGTISGIAAIWTTDARMEANTPGEWARMLGPIPPEPPKGPDVRRQPPKNNATKPDVDRRRELVADITHPELVPKEVSAKASPIPPVRDNATTILDDHNSNGPVIPFGPPGTGKDASSETNLVPAKRLDVVDDPPPAPTPKPKPEVLRISDGPMNGRAIYLPKPPYPSIAIQAHAKGTVVVQVLIGEDGKVISAKAISGHPLLLAVAQTAARGATFTPTKLSGQPVKVSGIITYNFTLE